MHECEWSAIPYLDTLACMINILIELSVIKHKFTSCKQTQNATHTQTKTEFTFTPYRGDTQPFITVVLVIQVSRNEKFG